MTTERETNRRGNYSMFMGVFATAVIGFGALGVDLSYIAMSNNQAQAVSDAASHAAIIAYRYSNANSDAGKISDGQSAADHIVATNKVGLGESGNLTDLTFGQYDPATGTFSAVAPFNAASARVERSGGDALQLLLAPVIGQATADVRQTGVTALNSREIIVVVDRSCSMAWPIENPDVEPGFVGARNALTAFSTYMIENQGPDDMLGVTDFTDTGSTWDPLRYIYGSETAISTKWASWGTGDEACDTWQYWNSRRERWEWTQAGYSCDSSTNQGAGIDLAVDALMATTNPTAFKGIIVISDGNPTTGSVADATAAFHAATQRAWDEDIHVWTVGFGSDIDDDLMDNVIKGGVGTYYRLPDSNGLEEVMLSIARSIPVAMVQ